MILAAGLSPAWQRIMQFDALEMGEVNRASQVSECASGKVINVGLAAARLGHRVQVLTCGGGVFGPLIERELLAAGCDCLIVPTQSPTRTCTTVMDRGSKRVTELVENAPPVGADEISAFRRAFGQLAGKASLLVFSGSLPGGVDRRLFAELMHERPALPVVMDIRGPELHAALPLRPLLVKPNREELGHTVGRTLSTRDDVRAAANQVIALGAQWVLVSDGPQAALLTNGDDAFELLPPQVETINPIACGDCLTAGMACGIERGASMVEAVRFGMAAAAANAARLLPADFTPADVEALVAKVRVQSV